MRYLFAFFSISVFYQTSAASENKARDLSGAHVGVNLVQSYSTARNHLNREEYVINGMRQGDTVVGFSKVERNKLEPSVNIGYSYLCDNNLWTGVSGEVIFGKMKKSTTNNFASGLTQDYSEREKIGGCSYSLKIKCGFYMRESKVAIYGIAGLDWRSTNFQFIDPANMEVVRLRKIAPVFGVGFEKAIYDKLSVCCEYEHYWKESDTTACASCPDQVAPGVEYFAQKYRSSLYGNSIKIGCKYYF